MCIDIVEIWLGIANGHISIVNEQFFVNNGGVLSLTFLFF